MTLLATEIDTIKEQTSKQLQDAETVLELEKQKLLKVNSPLEKKKKEYREVQHIFIAFIGTFAW